MDYFISFHDFLIECGYEREEVLEQASHGYIMVLWDVWEDRYIDYCESRDAEWEDLNNFA